MMKAVLYDEYGPPEVLYLGDMEKPVPKDHEILIKNHATTVSYGDLVARQFRYLTPGDFNMPLLFWFFAKVSFGLRKPGTRVLGSEFAGEIEATGQTVTHFQAGDPVFGYLGQGMGAYAEYICMPADGVVAHKPATMSYLEAAAVPSGGMTALYILNSLALQPGQKILINGASGGIGSHAVQIAKNHLGAEVTGVCGTPRLDFVKSLGADQVVDYTQEDFTQNGETYDVVFDILGRSSFAKLQGSLKPEGRYVLVSFKLKQSMQMLTTGLVGRRKVICALSPQRREDLVTLKGLIEAGQIKTIIDRCFFLEQTAEAHRYVESGVKTGQVVISIAHQDQK